MKKIVFITFISFLCVLSCELKSPSSTAITPETETKVAVCQTPSPCDTLSCDEEDEEIKSYIAKTSDEAYAEGYRYGYKSGVYDGEVGDSLYDNSNPYKRHLKERYEEGYDKGYYDGYDKGEYIHDMIQEAVVEEVKTRIDNMRAGDYESNDWYLLDIDYLDYHE